MSLPTFTFKTTAEEVATVFANEIKGKNVLITGTSINGFGFETARVVAKYAHLVIIAGYSSDRLKVTEEAIKKEVPSANIRRLILDLSSLAAVRKAAAEVNAYPEPIHVLINNAATAVGPFKLTVDNLENQFATNHVGPFLFTNLIAQKILEAGSPTYTPRVVFVSSAGYALGKGIDFIDIEKPDPEKHQNFIAYWQSKSANILTAIELSKRSKGRINAYSLHPGTSNTNLMQKEESLPEMQKMGVLGPDGTPNEDHIRWKTIPQGAATIVTAAFDTRLNDKPGAYLIDSNDATSSIVPHSSDPAVAEKLWTVTERIVGQTFSF